MISSVFPDKVWREFGARLIRSITLIISGLQSYSQASAFFHPFIQNQTSRGFASRRSSTATRTALLRPSSSHAVSHKSRRVAPQTVLQSNSSRRRKRRNRSTGFSASSESRTRPRRFAPPRYARGELASPAAMNKKRGRSSITLSFSMSSCTQASGRIRFRLHKRENLLCAADWTLCIDRNF